MTTSARAETLAPVKPSCYAPTVAALATPERTSSSVLLSGASPDRPGAPSTSGPGPEFCMSIGASRMIACVVCGASHDPLRSGIRDRTDACSRSCASTLKARRNHVPPEVRFWANVNKTETCWLWTAGGVESNGLRYGRFHVGKRAVMAHRFAYETMVGPIPDGLTIDHVWARGCTSTLCVNPSHLEAVTLKVNVLRGNGMGAIHARKTHCYRGHPLSGDNLTTELGGKARRCRACRRLRGKLERDALTRRALNANGQEV